MSSGTRCPSTQGLLIKHTRYDQRNAGSALSANAWRTVGGAPARTAAQEFSGTSATWTSDLVATTADTSRTSRARARRGEADEREHDRREGAPERERRWRQAAADAAMDGRAKRAASEAEAEAARARERAAYASGWAALLEGSSRAPCHIFDIYTLSSVIRPAQADLLPIEGRACLLLFFNIALQAYDLEASLLFFGKFEHTWSIDSREREYSGIVARPSNTFLSNAWNASVVWYAIQ